MVSPPPGVSSAVSSPPSAVGEAGGHGQAESDSLAGWRVTEPLERLEEPLLVVLGDAGSVVDHPQPHLGPGSLGGHLDAGRARASTAGRSRPGSR